ncbi:MAG TPA: acyl-CoA thioesterase domain-containing protein [Candidatus Dormibacteraeota bacterium]
MAESELTQALTLSKSGDGFAGVAPKWRGPYLFGGFIVGQAVFAAGLTVPRDRRIHSLHAYFLLPALAERPLCHRVETVRDGRTFSQRSLQVEQEGQVIFTMLCSFTAAPAETVFEQPFDPSIPDPEGMPAERARGGWDVVRLDPGAASSRRAWFRVTEDAPDDPLLNDAMLGFFSDMTGMGGHPIPLPNVNDWVSLDHAVWFHRPLRIGDWLYYETQTLVAAEKRATIRATIHGPDRRLGLSMTQEALLRRG